MQPISAASEVQAAAWRPRLTNFAEVFCVSKLKLFTNESGQTMAEYGVILAMITATVISALLLFSDGIQSGFMKAITIISGGP
jgi:Flp pilus assembly pilin Flp